MLARRIALVLLFIALPSLGAAQLRITTDKDTLNFTKVKLGFSRDGTLRVSNTSLTTVNVNDMTIVTQNSVFGEFQIIVPQPPVYHIDSGDGRSVILRFKPIVGGVRTAALEIFTDDGIKEVELSGEGSTIQPDILVVPQLIDFGMLAPGEFKDTTFLVIGGDKDSATINGINVANDNGAIYFDVTPLDPLVTFPIGIRPGDTLKLNVRFSAFNASGPRSGRALMEGEVSGEILCEFRAAVGIPNMVFSPQFLDLGIVPQGSAVDTSISIASIGESSVKLQQISPPGLPYYSISNVPSFPYAIAAGDSLKIGVHFAADAVGDWEDAINAFSKNGSAARINKSALIKAIVIPRVLSKISPQPFVVSCAIDSSYQRTLSIIDTGNFPISISNVIVSDPDFIVKYPSPFPDTILNGSRRDITITFKHLSGTVTANKLCIVNILTGGRVIVSDTIQLRAQPENAQLAITNITSTSAAPYSNTIGIVTVSDLAQYKLTSLEMDLTVDPPDVAEIDMANVSLDKSILPNATMKITYDQISKKYLAAIISSTTLPSSVVIPFLRIPLRYYVAKDSSATLLIATRSPEKEGCLFFASDSITISAASNCGDAQLRNFLNNNPLLSVVKITPNPSHGSPISVSFSNAENILLSSELSDMNGKIILRHAGASFAKGKNMLAIEISDIASGTYALHLYAQTADGKSQNVFSTLILSR